MRRSGLAGMVLAATVLAAGVGALFVAPTQGSVQITEFDLHPSRARPANIAVGPDGNLWFPELEGNAIGRIAPAGRVRTFTVPTGKSGAGTSGPHGIIAGPDGAMWFTESFADKIGRITTGGAITEYPLPGHGTSTCPYDLPGPAPANTSYPHNIAVGADGNLWFAQQLGNSIGRITTTGSVTEFPLPTPCGTPHGITAGPDGQLWFTERDGNKIGRINPRAGGDALIQASIAEFPIPGTPCTNDQCPVDDAGVRTIVSTGPHGISVGPDGNLWFGENWTDRLGRITVGGVITEFPVPSSPPQDPAAGRMVNNTYAGADGNLWFTELYGNRVGRINPAGTDAEIQASIVAFFLPTGSPQASNGPASVVNGPPADPASMWVTENFASKIARVALPG